MDPESDTLAVKVRSKLLVRGQLGFFFDYPYATGESRFEAPFVGVWDAVERHRTELDVSKWGKPEAKIMHRLDDTAYYTLIRWDGGSASIKGPLEGSHRYILQPEINHGHDGSFELTATFSPAPDCQIPSDVDSITHASARWWKSYWGSGAFIDLTATGNTTALELQRRIILSQYLLAVNEARKDPPQESGLVNDPETVSDHPALIAIYGLLPSPPSHPSYLNLTTISTTFAQVSQSWNFTSCWGWDFPMLAMTAARLGDVDSAIRHLVDNENFAFDDVGMPVGPVGKGVPTPYFPGSGGLLLAKLLISLVIGEENDVAV